jgi:hypothetical protein
MGRMKYSEESAHLNLTIRSPESLLISTRDRCCSIGQPFSRSMAFRPWKRIPISHDPEWQLKEAKTGKVHFKIKG